MYGGYTPMPTPGGGPGFGSYGYQSSSMVSPSDERRLDDEMHTLIKNLKEFLLGGSVDELKTVNSDESRLISLIEDSDQVKNLKKMRLEKISENKDLASLNLSLKPELQISMEKLTTLSGKQSSLKDEHDKLEKQLGELSKNFSLQDTLEKLKIATLEIDEETEELSQKMLDKDLEFEDFLNTYLSKRTLYHTRRIKAEKMSDIINKTPTTNYYSSGYGRY